ncbi:hypothetical protein [Litorivita pollutaquae]|uniref:hypothetical protein n=1 Tax=Litorivita pollutaquae TaxID=2200892 RepID=UPI0019553054|nr:hypothetical protein [Litorivita pollutaquae]
MSRLFYAVCAALLFALGACTDASDLHTSREQLGNFALGHNVVVAPHLVKGPLSREVDDATWIKSVEAEINARLGRYSGSKLYHIGVSLDGYVLAAPGVPLVFSPKSVLIINVTAWDDAAGKKLNDEPKQLTVFENGGTPFLGSGLTQSKEQQLANLSRNAAKMIEIWLERQHREQGWFAETPAQKAERLAAEKADPVIARGSAAQAASDQAAADENDPVANTPPPQEDTASRGGAEAVSAAAPTTEAQATDVVPMAAVIEKEPVAPLTWAERRAARKAAREAKAAASTAAPE